MPPVDPAPGGTSLIDVLDRILDKGIVIDAWVRVSRVGIDLITVEARVVVASVDTYLHYAAATGITAPVAWPPAQATPHEELAPAEEVVVTRETTQTHTVPPPISDPTVLLRGMAATEARGATARDQARRVGAARGWSDPRKDTPITDADIDRLMPFATQAGTALVRAGDVERLRDTTEQHLVEKEWLWWMVNGVADPVILTDATNDIVHKNICAESLFRSRPDDSEGKRRAIWMNNFLFTAALSTSVLDENDGRTGRELTLVDPIEGTELLFEMITFPATNYFNGSRGTVAVLKNITDLRRAAEQLDLNVHRLQTADEEIRLERDRLNLILRSVPNPIILMDREDQTILMNRQAARLIQASASDTAHRSRRAQICVSNETKFSSFVSGPRLDPSQGMSGEIVLTDPDTHEHLTMAVTSTEVRDEFGAVAATVSVMQDMSRRRELERRRIEQILFDSEKLAATGRLAASIAHEINNPLEAIKNSLYLLSNKITPDNPNYRFLQIATKETDRVSRILRQMLGFYRAPKMEPTDINRLIEDAEGLIQKHLAQHRVRLDNRIDADLPLVVASADQIKQVLLNLMLNAQQAMPEGGTITVSARASHGADAEFLLSESVHVQITDTGKGIPEDILPHIFEPFFSTKDEKGTGLGLWVSYGIVQNHGGSIKVRSRDGRGTTFSIALPIRGPEHAAG